MNQTDIKKIKQHKEDLLLLAFYTASAPTGYSELAKIIRKEFNINGPLSHWNIDILDIIYTKLKPIFDESELKHDTDLLNLKVTMKDVIDFYKNNGSKQNIYPNEQELIKITEQRYRNFK